MMPKEGDLRVWWIPQVPMEKFVVSVQTLDEAALLITTLGAYDLFQLQNGVRGDYANAGGLQIWEEDEDASGLVDWYDSESGCDFEAWMEFQERWKL